MEIGEKISRDIIFNQVDIQLTRQAFDQLEIRVHKHLYDEIFNQVYAPNRIQIWIEIYVQFGNQLLLWI